MWSAFDRTASRLKLSFIARTMNFRILPEANLREHKKLIFRSFCDSLLSPNGTQSVLENGKSVSDCNYVKAAASA